MHNGVTRSAKPYPNWTAPLFEMGIGSHNIPAVLAIATVNSDSDRGYRQNGWGKQRSPNNHVKTKFMDSQNVNFDSPNLTLSDFDIGGSRWHWLGRGLLAGLMIAAAVNALSYFCRSDGILNMIGASEMQEEAIGFPMEVWRRGQAYGRMVVNFTAFFTNCTVGFVFALIVAAFTGSQWESLNRIVLQSLTQEAQRKRGASGSFQFSIKSMLIATSVIALFLAAAMNVSADPKVLAVIFFAGPWVMVGLSMLPPNIKWQHRIVMMTVMAIVMIAVAIVVGGQLGKLFDETLLGIFICWTPQAVVGIVLLVGYIIFKSKSKT